MVVDAGASLNARAERVRKGNVNYDQALQSPGRGGGCGCGRGCGSSGLVCLGPGHGICTRTQGGKQGGRALARMGRGGRTPNGQPRQRTPPRKTLDGCRIRKACASTPITGSLASGPSAPRRTPVGQPDTNVRLGQRPMPRSRGIHRAVVLSPARMP